MMEAISESEEKSGGVDETCIIEEESKEDTHYTGVVFGKDKVCIDELSGRDVSCTKKASGNDETCKEEETRPIDELSCLHLDNYTSVRTTKDYRNIHSHCIAGTSIDELLWKYYHCFCYVCETRFHRLHACLICPYFACYENYHIQEHCYASGHCLAVDITTGNIYCFLCKDYVYDHRYEHISRRQKEKRGQYIASWFPTETVKLIDREDVLISTDYLFQDPYVPKNIGEWQLFVEPGKIKFKFHVYFKKRGEGSEEDEYEEYESYEDEEDEQKEKIVTEKIQSTEENVENISQNITDVEISQIETLSSISKPKSAKTRRNRKSKGKGSKAKTKRASQNEKTEETIEMCDSGPLKGVSKAVSEDLTESVTPEVLTSSSASKQIPQPKRRKVIKKRKIGLPSVEIEFLDKEKFEAIVSRFMPKQRSKHRCRKRRKKIKTPYIELPEEAVEEMSNELDIEKIKEKNEEKKSDIEPQEGAVETRCQDLTENVTSETKTLKSILKKTSHQMTEEKVSCNKGKKRIVFKEMSEDLAENEEMLKVASTPEPEILLEKIKDEKKKETSDLKSSEENVVIIRQGKNDTKPSEENVVIMHQGLTDDEEMLSLIPSSEQVHPKSRKKRKKRRKKGKQVIILKNVNQDLTKCDKILKLDITPEYSAITYEDRKNELPEEILEIRYNNLPDEDDAILTLIPSSKPVIPEDRKKGETEEKIETFDLDQPEGFVEIISKELSENKTPDTNILSSASKQTTQTRDGKKEEKMETCDLEQPEGFAEIISKELSENKTPDTSILSSASKKTTRKGYRKKGRSRGKGFKRKSEETGIPQTKTVTETPQTEISDAKSISLQTKKKSSGQKSIEDTIPLPCTDKTIGLRGLVNISSSTCYLNSLLQVLIHIPILRNIFLSMKHNPVVCRFTNTETMCLACEMYSLTQEFFSGKTSPIIPSQIFYLIWKLLFEKCYKTPQLDNPLKEQDAHEFLLFILQLLHEHMKSEGDDGNNCKCYIHLLFYGVLQQELCCLDCGKKRIKLEDFNNLSLTLGTSSQRAAVDIKELSLTECLNMYMGSEELEFFCDDCHGKTSKKITKVHTAPVLMSFHLNRLESANTKIETYVSFPERLNLFPYIREIPNEEEKDSSTDEKEEGISTNEEREDMCVSTNEKGEDMSTNEEGESMSTNEKEEVTHISLSTNEEGESMSTNEKGEGMSTNEEGESMSTNEKEEVISTKEEGESMSNNEEGEATSCDNMAVGEYSGKETSTRESENVCPEERTFIVEDVCLEGTSAIGNVCLGEGTSSGETICLGEETTVSENISLEAGPSLNSASNIYFGEGTSTDEIMDFIERNTRREEFIPTFDEKLLQMGMNENTYSLIGVICHHGAADAGHYIAYIKMHGKWFLCNDLEVIEVDTTSVLNSNAYLLFYQKDILQYEKKSREELFKEMIQNAVVEYRERTMLEHLWKLVAFKILKVKK